MKKGKSSVPSLGRKWDKKLGRWIVVLKVEKWDQGIILMSESPLAFCGSNERPMANINTELKEITQNVNNLEEKSRVKRWLKATQLKWKSEEILFHEILYYCSQHLPKNKKSGINHKESDSFIIGPVKPPPLETVENTNLGQYSKHAEGLFVKHAYDIYFKSEAPNMKENMLEILRQSSFQNSSIFSQLQKGIGWYPLLGHIRRVPIDSPQINTCIWFQNSTANLASIKPLIRGQEIVVADDPMYSFQSSLIPPPITNLNLNSIPNNFIQSIQQFITNINDEKIIKGKWKTENITWQTLARLTSIFGHEAILFIKNQLSINDELSTFATMLKDKLLSFLKKVWIEIETMSTIGSLFDMIRCEFLYIFLERHPLLITPTIDEKKLTKANEKKEIILDMGVPALNNFMGEAEEIVKVPPALSQMQELNDDEWKFYQQLTVICNRHLMIYDLLPILLNDPAAQAYQHLWNSNNNNHGLIDKWNKISDKLNKKHPSFYSRD